MSKVTKEYPLDYGHAEEAQLTASEKFRSECYLTVIDQLITSIAHRISAYEEVDNYFGFLRILNSLSVIKLRKKL